MEHNLEWVNKVSTLLSKIQKKNNRPFSTALACSTLIVYMVIVRYLRYKSLKSIIAKYPDPQQVLDDLQAAREIYANFLNREFPHLARQGTELALFKTYSIPTISKTLMGTGEMVQRCPRRVEDTELILGEMLQAYARIQNQKKRKPDTPEKDIDAQYKRQEEARSRLNQIHGKYSIRNEDYLYTAALFVTEPQLWINRYEWRKLDVRESNAIFRVWYDVSVSMNLKNIPDTPQKLIEFKNAYAKNNIKYSPSNWKCAEPTVRLLLSNLPVFLQGQAYKIGLKILPSVLDRADAEAFRLPAETQWITWTIRSVLGIRALFIRHFMLPRSNYLIRTPFYANGNNRLLPEFPKYTNIYKNGYVIADLGPE